MTKEVEVDWAAVHRAISAPVGPSCWPLPIDTPVSELLVLSHAWHPQRPRQYRILGVSTETLGERLRREDNRDEFVKEKVEELNGRGIFDSTSSNANDTADAAKEFIQLEDLREREAGEKEEEAAVGAKRKAQGVGSRGDDQPQQQQQHSIKKAKPPTTREVLEYMLADSSELIAEVTSALPHKMRCSETGEDIRHEPKYPRETWNRGDPNQLLLLAAKIETSEQKFREALRQRESAFAPLPTKIVLVAPEFLTHLRLPASCFLYAQRALPRLYKWETAARGPLPALQSRRFLWGIISA